MATFLDSYLSKLENAKSNVENDLLSLLVEKESEIKQMIKERWLLGRRPDGDIIGVYRDSQYQLLKSSMNSQSGGTVDLILTGSLVGRIKTVLQSKGIEIISTDEKYTEIANKYGYDNFNITEEQENELLDEVMAQVVINAFNKIW